MLGINFNELYTRENINLVSHLNYFAASSAKNILLPVQMKIYVNLEMYNSKIIVIDFLYNKIKIYKYICYICFIKLKSYRNLCENTNTLSINISSG